MEYPKLTFVPETDRAYQYAFFGDKKSDHITFTGKSGNQIPEDIVRRIVATWNACEGLETELLETLPLNFKAHALQYADLRTQNAALLAAVKEMKLILPVVERLEKELPQTWDVVTQGTGIATLNGYRDKLGKALEAVKNNNQ